MKQAKGFSLVELIVVIVILGILSATALPRFMGLSRSATIAKLQQMESTLRSATQLVRAQALIQGKTTGVQVISHNGVNIRLREGYPVGVWDHAIRYLINLDEFGFSPADEVCTQQWCGRGAGTSLPSGISLSAPALIVKLVPSGYRWIEQCGVYYINHGDGSPAEIGLETNDCR